MHPVGKIQVARQHGSDRQRCISQFGRNVRLERAGIADASGAAEADDAEAEGFQGLIESGASARPRLPGYPVRTRSSPRA